MNITLGQKLKYLRKKKNLTQKELGTAVGFNEKNAQHRILQYEHGDRNPKYETASKLADVLGITTDILLMPIVLEPEDSNAIAFWKKELPELMLQLNINY